MMTQFELRNALEDALGPDFKDYLPVNGPIDTGVVLKIIRAIVCRHEFFKEHVVRSFERLSKDSLLEDLEGECLKRKSE